MVSRCTSETLSLFIWFPCFVANSSGRCYLLMYVRTIELHVVF